MKKQVKRFSQYIKESMHTREHEVKIDFGYGTLEEMAAGFAELASIAPNCEVSSTRGVKGDYMDIVITGPSDECRAVSDYWNSLRGGSDIYASRSDLLSTSDMAGELRRKRIMKDEDFMF